MIWYLCVIWDYYRDHIGLLIPHYGIAWQLYTPEVSCFIAFIDIQARKKLIQRTPSLRYMNIEHLSNANYVFMPNFWGSKRVCLSIYVHANCRDIKMTITRLTVLDLFARSGILQAVRRVRSFMASNVLTETRKKVEIKQANKHNKQTKLLTQVLM